MPKRLVGSVNPNRYKKKKKKQWKGQVTLTDTQKAVEGSGYPNRDTKKAMGQVILTEIPKRQWKGQVTDTNRAMEESSSRDAKICSQISTWQQYGAYCSALVLSCFLTIIILNLHTSFIIQLFDPVRCFMIIFIHIDSHCVLMTVHVLICEV